MGPTWSKKKKKNQNQKEAKREEWRERALVQRVLYFFKFLVFKSSFSDSRVSDRRNSSG